MHNFKKTTIVFPRNQKGFLLGMKKRGFGEGWWNGFGGKLEPGESYEDSAIRETKEESGIQIYNLDLIANIHFYSEDKLDVISKVYLAKYSGKPIETAEMRPQTFARGNLPFDQMWPADRFWVPKVLSTNINKALGFIVYFNKDNSFSKIQETTAIKLEPIFY
jgi:ADP-ribose pyrophosphatase YjhB (NUDIX family)